MKEKGFAEAIRQESESALPLPTGQEIWEKALSLLGYEMETERASMLAGRGLCLLNVIVEDLRTRIGEPFTPLASLQEELPPLGGKGLESAAAYGVAMLLAQLEGDGDNQSFWARVYEGKREAAISTGRLDVLPRPYGG